MDALEENSVEETESVIKSNNGKSSSIIKSPVKETWTYHHEKIFIEWADKAMCYRWLHNSAHIDYKGYNTWFTIPVICISTVTGTANFAQDRFSDSMKPMVQVAIGTCNIIAAILTTIQQFLKISELNEAHRVSSLLWGKFYRDIKVEMAKSPLERKPPSILLKHCKNEYDRLMEVSPIIPQFTINNFKDTFSGKKKQKLYKTQCKLLCCCGTCKTEDKYEYTFSEIEDDTSSISNTPKMLTNSNKNGSKKVKLSHQQKIDKMRAAFDKIHKPEICDELVSTEETRFKLAPNEVLHETLDPTIELNEIKKKYESISISFVQNFANINGREPTYIEYNDGIAKTIPQEFINKELYNTSIRELKGPVIA